MDWYPWGPEALAKAKAECGAVAGRPRRLAPHRLRQFRAQRDEFALRMVTLTLEKMAAGGIFDHLGGGCHRYSVDNRWLVPHFEKIWTRDEILAHLGAERRAASPHLRGDAA